MSDFLESIESIKASARSEASNVSTLQEAKEVKVRYLGKKGKVTELLKGLGQVSKEDRPLVGKKVNELKQELESLFDTLLTQQQQNEQQKKIQSERDGLQERSRLRSCKNLFLLRDPLQQKNLNLEKQQ